MYQRNEISQLVSDHCIDREMRLARFASIRTAIFGSMFALTILVSTPVTTAWACVCGPVKREEQLKTATNIVRATLQDIHPVIDREYVSFKLEFQVSEIWKGLQTQRITAYVMGLDRRSCSIPLQMENDYIVYVDSIVEPNGDVLPFVSGCGLTEEYSNDHAVQLDRELARRLAIGITPTPRPPTPAVCPTVALESRIPTPSPNHALAFTCHFPAVILSSGIITELAAPILPCRTPTPTTPPDLSKPPELIMADGISRSGGGLGSRCWWSVDQCLDAPGVASLPGTWTTSSPLTAKFYQLPEGYPPPSSWQLWIGEVGPNDYSTVPGQYLHFWHPKELREVTLDPIEHTTVPLALDLRLYVFKLRVEWGASVEEPGALGWVEYGWAIEVDNELSESHSQHQLSSQREIDFRLMPRPD